MSVRQRALGIQLPAGVRMCHATTQLEVLPGNAVDRPRRRRRTSAGFLADRWEQVVAAYGSQEPPEDVVQEEAELVLVMQHILNRRAYLYSILARTVCG